MGGTVKVGPTSEKGAVGNACIREQIFRFFWNSDFGAPYFPMSLTKKIFLYTRLFKKKKIRKRT